MEELWLGAISEYGFPVVVTFYLLYRIEKKLDTLNQSVLQLQQACPLNPNKYQSPTTKLVKDSNG
ncbi:YvrJ family protein [Salipaludibacillus keqinensis]|uniref:YvrJ family protein n=1 Tax=Salipaludibacillus keqinensis TaxID=2045207 RepID=A0A323TH87_9BACI|nr:YvrJ family protein [Salipaludibacillus keqinensis]PYZ93586.1 YvrJ family protein [Salipaludibacillus keqinensis]